MAKRLARTLAIAGAMIGVVGVAVGLTIWGQYRAFVNTPLAVGPSGATFVVANGSSVGDVADELAERGWLGAPGWFVWTARLTGRARQLQAGEYRIPPGMKPRQLLDRMVAGKVVQHRLTVVEGWTFRELMKEVNGHPALKHTLEGQGGEAIMAALGYPGEHPEGWFYPDTYHFPRGTTDLAFLRRAHRMMRETLNEAWAKREADLPLDGPYEALILASIVERETALAEERAKIAGVFVRRLRRGMRLQTDPTIIYGMGSEFDGDIRDQDLRRASPYNTYQRAGLPPTPIALPSKGAIEAVLHPAAGQALYFVAKGDGSHKFSATLKEHNRAVRKYQLGR